jgi:hypothetical protein
MPPATSYPSPNAAQMAQGSMPYYATNRQLTADELLSAELSRETSGPGLNDGSSNGVHHGQSMVMGSSNPGGADMGRPSSPDQHQQHMLQFTPSQQVGVDPNHDLSYGDQSARRKRSKISRACDECRRKKVGILHLFPSFSRWFLRDATPSFKDLHDASLGPLRRKLRIRCRDLLELSPTRCRVSIQSRAHETRS